MNEISHQPAATTPKRWKAAAPAVKPQAIARSIINLAFLIWAVRDIRRRSADEIKGNRKFWLAAAFVTPIGPIAYFIFGRKRGDQPAEIPLEVAQQA